MLSSMQPVPKPLDNTIVHLSSPKSAYKHKSGATIMSRNKKGRKLLPPLKQSSNALFDSFSMMMAS